MFSSNRLREAQQEINDYYLWKLPRRFWRLSGIDTHNFQIREPWCEPYEHALTIDSTTERIAPSAHCMVKHGPHFVHILIPIHSDPLTAQCILSLGKFHFSGTSRSEKYLIAFKAYEAISPEPKLDFACIRHSLTHAQAKLDRLRTLDAIRRIFGESQIDFKKAAHLAQFYKTLGLLLMETDTLLCEHLIRNLSQYLMPSRYRSVLMESQN